MHTDHTVWTRSAVVALCASVLLEVALLVGGHAPYVEALLVALVAAGAAAALGLHRGNSLESRLVAGLLATTTGAGVVLAATLGAPGAIARPWDLLAIGILALAAAVVTLLSIDHARRAAAQPTRSPYAS